MRRGSSVGASLPRNDAISDLGAERAGQDGSFLDDGAIMQTSSKTLIDLETKFWQSMVDQDTDTAISLLDEPALMVSSHGAMKFDHAG